MTYHCYLIILSALSISPVTGPIPHPGPTGASGVILSVGLLAAALPHRRLMRLERERRRRRAALCRATQPYTATVPQGSQPILQVAIVILSWELLIPGLYQKSSVFKHFCRFGVFSIVGGAVGQCTKVAKY